jgi:hypothetical protein
VAEYPFAGRIECLDDTVLIHGQYDILDVIENDLQMLGALLADLERQRPGLVRHEPQLFELRAQVRMELGTVLRGQTFVGTDLRSRFARVALRAVHQSANLWI